MWKVVFICVISALALCEARNCEIWGFETQDVYPLPLFESADGLLYIDPKDVGSLDIQDGGSMTITCVDSHLEYYGVGYKRRESTVMNCRDGAFFSDEWIPGKELFFKWISCALPMNGLERFLENGCGGENKQKGRLLEVYVKSIMHRGHSLYESCFDDTINQPLYVKNILNKYNVKYFTHLATKDFKGDGELFYDMRIDEFYLVNYQMNLLYELLGNKFSDYLNNDRIIIGPLIDENNYPFNPLQRATYNYANVVPMWDKIRKGSWESSNKEIKDLIGDKELTVFSGAWGVLTLADTIGNQKEIRLESVESKRYPMPLWLYRVIYEESTKKGLALLILNNPFITLAEGEELAEIFQCNDVCPDWKWIVDVEVKNGYVTCCEIDDFRKTIKDLPEFETTGVFP